MWRLREESSQCCHARLHFKFGRQQKKSPAKMRLDLGLLSLLPMAAGWRTYDEAVAKKAGFYSSIAYADIANIKSWSNFKSSDCTTRLPV